VTVRVESDRVSAVTFVGGGWTHWLTGRWGVRADARLMFSRNSVTFRLDAAPGRLTTNDRSQQFGLIFGGGDPAVTLYNGSDLPQGTSLSADPIRDFVTFSGSGWDRHLVTTIGAVWRF
jgi:hypothetical protein